MGKHRKRTALATPAAAIAVAGTVTLAAPAAFAGDGVPDRWEAVVECESGGDPNAVNPNSGAAGAWQFMPSTWDAHAPAGYPDSPLDATMRQQLVVAERVLAAQGPGAWVCDGAPGSASDVSAPTPQPEPAPEPEAPSPEPEPLERDAGKPTGVGSSPAVDPQYPADNYVIEAGDTLGEVADEHATTVPVLVDANPRTVEDPDLIYPSEGLYIP